MIRIVADHRAVEPKKTETVKRELSETRLVRATAADICLAPIPGLIFREYLPPRSIAFE